ncbi:cytochrome C [Sulfuricella sp. T08]|uniref:c-type cytochrome n=1 Tax=Sulfuricella sp. T08 TaxID=1632857 RepID=UPI0006179E8F|nr:c-type cytochrome [Sulfuricella sp. T08]GAO36504.1 cytochrome C [Sulfuricella sp. T08]
MKHKTNRQIIAATLFTFSAAMLMPSQASAFDEDAARALAKRNDCFKCHAVDKSKKGPSYKKVADKYRGKADGQSKLITNFTTEPMVKLSDGKEEKHKIIDTKDMNEMKNLADWILSIQ